MKNKYAVLIVALLVFMAADSLQPAIAQDNSSTNPAAIGSPVRSMVELGSVYTNIYDTTITVLEAVRGKEAMDRLKAADPANKMPAAGFEYVLARIKFEHKGRAVSDKIPFDLGNAPLQWIALTGKDLTEYDRVSVTVPKPALAGMVNPGQAVEGWVAFAVDVKDSKPVMVFDPDTGGATGRGRTLFFKLY
ncbi:MAG: hypothetical protein H6Q07_79 [Acidobacteria bacterium]|jgi:hypothetical protein|nr:hypothetical protein [Acidobacteriota bacterium]